MRLNKKYRKYGLYGLLAVLVMIGLLYALRLGEKPTIAAVVVPHHDIVKEQRLAFWQQLMTKIDADAITKIIIIGPNHFGVNQQVIVYDDTDWSTSAAPLKNLLRDQSDLPSTFVKSTGLIKSDHAVFNLVGETKQNFPNALFVPFLIGQKVAFKHLQPLQDYIDKTCGTSDCLLIASVDFSHYVKESAARKQDERTVTLLATKTLTEKSLNQHGVIEADSPQSLYVLQEFAGRRDLQWWLQNQTNSAFGNPETTDTTSHVFAGYLKH